MRVRVEPRATFVISRGPKSHVDLQGIITCFCWGGNRLPCSIKCNGTLKLEGELLIGPNVHIFVGPDGALEIGAGQNGGPCAIQADAFLLVEELVQIGADSGVGVYCLVSDSHWHHIEGSGRTAPIIIGEHVWMTHGISILKGVSIGSGCIVGARSVLVGGSFPEKALIAGNPAKVIRTGVEWSW